MITWTYKELPDINWDHPGFDESDTYYSHRVLAMVRFTSSLSPPEPRFATYLRHEKWSQRPDTWIVEGMYGNVEIICWTYITVCDINIFKNINYEPK